MHAFRSKENVILVHFETVVSYMYIASNRGAHVPGGRSLWQILFYSSHINIFCTVAPNVCIS
jgi:hypothetical protein